MGGMAAWAFVILVLCQLVVTEVLQFLVRRQFFLFGGEWLCLSALQKNLFRLSYGLYLHGFQVGGILPIVVPLTSKAFFEQPGAL